MPFPVDETSLAPTNRREPRTRSLASRNGDVRLIIHHAYNRTVDATIATFNNPNRTVSANFAIGPHVAGSSDVRVVLCVPEGQRAYTSNSELDDKALTVETSNLLLTPPYPVAQTAKHALARIAAYMHTEYGMPLDRQHVISHQEVTVIEGDPWTECPGGDLQGSLDAIVAEAKQIVAGGGGGSIQRKDDNMTAATLYFQHNSDGNQAWIVEGAWGFQIVSTDYAIAIAASQGISDMKTIPKINEYGFNALNQTKQRDLAMFQGQLPAEQIDTTQLALQVSAAVVAAIQDQGIEVDTSTLAPEIAAAVDAALADNFAAIPDAVADEAADRLRA